MEPANSPQQVYIGGGGSGSFLQSGGTSTSTGSLNIGWGGNVTATYSLSSSGQLSAATENVGMFGGTAIFAIRRDQHDPQRRCLVCWL